MFPRTWIPQLQGQVEAGSPTVFACAILAGPDAGHMQALFASIPDVPDIADLEAIFARSGSIVEICEEVG